MISDNLDLPYWMSRLQQLTPDETADLPQFIRRKACNHLKLLEPKQLLPFLDELVNLLAIEKVLPYANEVIQAIGPLAKNIIPSLIDRAIYDLREQNLVINDLDLHALYAYGSLRSWPELQFYLLPETIDAIDPQWKITFGHLNKQLNEYSQEVYIFLLIMTLYPIVYLRYDYADQYPTFYQFGYLKKYYPQCYEAFQQELVKVGKLTLGESLEDGLAGYCVT